MIAEFPSGGGKHSILAKKGKLSDVGEADTEDLDDSKTHQDSTTTSPALP